MSTSLLTELPPQTTSNAARQLRTIAAAVRLSFTWLGVRKSLSSEQKSQAAESFGAEEQFLSAGKKLLDTRHPAFKKVTSVRSRVVTLWKSLTLPFPEPGIRLIRQDKIEQFNAGMHDLRQELNQAVSALDERYDELKRAARQRLGTLYDPTDYPSSLAGLFGVAWDFPSVEPPEYLQQLNPTIYQQECQRVQARFDEAVQLAEQAFIEELSRLVSHLTERLSGQDDGKPKIFRDTAVENLGDFFHRFRELNVHSHQQLDDLVGQCQRIVRGVEPQELRDNQPLRQRVASELSRVGSVLDGLLVDRPRRNILRRPR